MYLDWASQTGRCINTGSMSDQEQTAGFLTDGKCCIKGVTKRNRISIEKSQPDPAVGEISSGIAMTSNQIRQAQMALLDRGMDCP
jgi:hypothetical protein